MSTILTTPGPLIVSRFEATLVRLLRGFLQPGMGDATGDRPLPAAGRLTAPKELSPACMHLVRDSLSKGCVQYLARAGGWRRERHLRQGQPAQGRLWERSTPPELGLPFSRHSLRFLVWLTAGRPDKENYWGPPENELTIGDQFLLFLAYEGLRGTDIGQSLRTHPSFQRHGLIRLCFADDFGPTGRPVEAAIWTEGLGACVLEALQPKFYQRWLDVERGKNQVSDWTKMRALGQSQDQALGAFLTSCDQSKRPDLARFLLRVLAEILTRDLTPDYWLGGLQEATRPPRLADRLETRREALGVLRQVETLTNWTRLARSTGFMDEHYAMAQLWLSDWEEYRGDEVAVIAQQLLRQIEPLRTGPANASAVDAAPTATNSVTT